MTKIFKLEGLDCAHCASKIETKIGKLKGVNEISINFVNGKMVLNADDEKIDEIVDNAEAIIHKLEPDVQIKAI